MTILHLPTHTESEEGVCVCVCTVCVGRDVSALTNNNRPGGELFVVPSTQQICLFASQFMSVCWAHGVQNEIQLYCMEEHLLM